jgi:hypothetical protein
MASPIIEGVTRPGFFFAFFKGRPLPGKDGILNQSKPLQ